MTESHHCRPIDLDAAREENQHLAWIALGSNIQPEFHLREAVRRLNRHGQLLAVSRVWETAAVGDPDQPDYLNAAVLLKTSCDAVELKLEVLAGIERELQRQRDPNNVNAARTIDLDVALFDDRILRIEHRRVPDPDILDRPFLATPLAELTPDYVHPETGETLAAIAARLGINAASMRLRDDVQLPV